MHGEKKNNLRSEKIQEVVEDKFEDIKSNQKSLIDSTSCNKPEAKLWFRGVRSSKFRHVYGSSKKECYTDISIHRNGHDGNVCAVNPIFLAIEADAAFIVILLNHTGRIDFQRCKVIGHCGQIFDLKWNPFDDFQIASASEDCTIKLWNIPEGGLTSTLSEFSSELLGHRRKITQLEWHPSTKNVLFSASFDNLVIVWDVSSSPLNGNILKIIDCHDDQIYSLAINREGSHIATTSKDRMLRVIEPRTGIVVTQGIAHNGMKQSKVVFLHDDKLLTTGFSKRSDRQYAIWNQHDLKNPLVAAEIDSASGILNPFYDYETKTLYLCGKGEGCIRYYEIVDEHPFIYYLNQFVSGQPQKALGWMPKRGLNVNICEIFRFYKLHASGNVVEPVSFIVPRKSTFFQTDLYPDTLSTKPAMNIEQWFVLGMNVKPILMSMKTDDCLLETIMKKSESMSQKPISIVKKDQSQMQNRKPFERIGVLKPSSDIIDNNISKKFAFLAQETVPDYRPTHEKFINKTEKTNTNQSTKIQQLHSIFTRDSINGNTTKNNISLEDNISLIHAENELKKIIQQQQDDIKNLRNQLKTSDKRIRELEFEIKRLRLEKN
ncbi:CLUMA_CG006239, isoform A [Clunio marinus]|uniref:Coronin n=1 Tax=Clunio marinus TaxID=568069 RepID=A0A1J1HXI0_9DIPT|nr:CLUMA_CG006239, isoform A [Clunio marinus]